MWRPNKIYLTITILSHVSIGRTLSYDHELYCSRFYDDELFMDQWTFTYYTEIYTEVIVRCCIVENIVTNYYLSFFFNFYILQTGMTGWRELRQFPLFLQWQLCLFAHYFSSFSTFAYDGRYYFYVIMSQHVKSYPGNKFVFYHKSWLKNYRKLR